MRLSAALLVATVCAGTHGVMAEGFPRGTLVERVVCRDDPGEAYALYLPSAYSAEKRWPIVYALDARSRALVPAELLRGSAERSFYLPRTLRQRCDHARAALLLAVAAQVRPEDPQVWYNLACGPAQAGWQRDASLERAVGAGFEDAARIESDADLAPLRGEPGYRELLERLAAGKQ